MGPKAGQLLRGRIALRGHLEDQFSQREWSQLARRIARRVVAFIKDSCSYLILRAFCGEWRDLS